ncbi:unnamed protein product [Clonostachys rosea]|uniref:Uncharacterized protein n=1 Tax=Bionectria ochroleuca TaxID=29856 RepID=A0ABY6UCW8_BIOOC|nr:unnamed protein product [Clonostachys rosea]
MNPNPAGQWLWWLSYQLIQKTPVCKSNVCSFTRKIPDGVDAKGQPKFRTERGKKECHKDHPCGDFFKYCYFDDEKNEAKCY